jgi:CelD/BcsL family acetyltransferase involved in cellulose biosynthesis
VAPAPDVACGGSVAREAVQAGDAADIVVERASAARLASLGEGWRTLAQRAEAPNIFMHPALLGEALAAYPARPLCVLLAWQGRQPARLVGIWAFAVGRAPRSFLPFDVLSAPATANAYLSTPVIDRDCLDAVCAAFLATIADDPRLPAIVALDAAAADTATYAALARAVLARGGAMRVFSRTQRPMLASGLDGKAYLERAMSASSRKKLRQHRRRLGERGTLASTVVGGAADVRQAFEDFLTLEASGWKGRCGTALLSDPADARFARAMIAALAAHGDAAIHSLTLDGRPVSMQIVLRAGRTAFTWKTAYDEALHDFSPGTLLFEDYTARLLADREIAAVDSCSFDDSGYMAGWQERAAIAQLWLAPRPRAAVAFNLLAGLQAAWLAGRARAKAFYLQHLRPKGR